MKKEEIWQVQVEGKIYKSDFKQLSEWVSEGRITRADLVKRGSLRWLSAGKVPALLEFFNSAGLHQTKPNVTTTDGQIEVPANHLVSGEIRPVENFNQNTLTNSQPTPTKNFPNSNHPSAGFENSPQHKPATSLLYCHFHRERFPEFICGTCTNLFCLECPQTMENKDVICPVCESKCDLFEPREEDVPTFQTQTQTQPLPPTGNYQKYVSDDVLSGANWFFGIAALTLINSIIIFSGFDWAFVLGLAFTQIFDVGASLVSEAGGGEGISIFHLVALVIDLVAVGIFCGLGYFARKGAGWAFITGMILYSLDTLLTIITFSFLGIGIHLFALYCIYRGYSDT